jgi:hypothetical protein
MDVKHEMREALMAYAAMATELPREQIEKDMTEEDHEELMIMVGVITEVAERYAQERVNKTAAELI